MIQNKSSIHLYGWMLNELHLKWSELIIYATIFSFTNWTDDHCFHGSSEYLGERAWVSRRQVTDSLRKLEEKSLIFRKEKKVNGVKFIDYYTNFPGWEKTSQAPWWNFSSYNRDIDSNKDIDKSISLQREEKEVKKYWEFWHILLVDEQYDKLRREIWWWLKDLIDDCDRWLELNPRKKYKNYYAFVKNRYKNNQKRIQNEIEVKQKLYANKGSKYIKQNNIISKQNQQQKFQQLLDDNKQYNGWDQNETANRRTKIWGESLFSE